MNEESVETNNEEVQDFESPAREMGWVSKEDWEGPEDKWIDARTFVEKGESVLPILRANNKRLKKDLLTRDKEISTLKESMEAANKAIKALQKSHNAVTSAAVEQAKKDLRAQLREAREAGDVDVEEDIRDKLDELKQTPSKEEVNTEEKPQLHPDFISWRDAHPWFTDNSTPESRKKIRDFVRIGEDLRDEGNTLVGKAFMDECLRLLDSRSGSTRKSTSKVESGSSGTRSSTSRGFESLPKEAKDACHEDNENFVGPGKMFKTVKEWEDHFTSVYNEE